MKKNQQLEIGGFVPRKELRQHKFRLEREEQDAILAKLREKLQARGRHRISSEEGAET